MMPFIPHSGFAREPVQSLDWPTVRDWTKCHSCHIHDIRLQRGYVSRHVDFDDDSPVFVSGDGRYYVLLPAFHTSRYCYRFYITPKG